MDKDRERMSETESDNDLEIDSNDVDLNDSSSEEEGDEIEIEEQDVDSQVQSGEDDSVMLPESVYKQLSDHKYNLQELNDIPVFNEDQEEIEESECGPQLVPGMKDEIFLNPSRK
jgi:hypothetical protein